VFGIAVSTLEIMGAGGLVRLGEVVAGRLAERLKGEERGGGM
jgi:hypothetical protein